MAVIFNAQIFYCGDFVSPFSNVQQAIIALNSLVNLGSFSKEVIIYNLMAYMFDKGISNFLMLHSIIRFSA